MAVRPVAPVPRRLTCTLTPNSPPPVAASSSSASRAAAPRRMSPPRWRRAQDRVQVVVPLARRGRSQPPRPIEPSATLPHPGADPHRASERSAAAPPQARPRAHRRATAHGPFDGLPCALPARSQPPCLARPPHRAGDPPQLRAPRARRPHPHRHQEAGPHPSGRWLASTRPRRDPYHGHSRVGYAFVHSAVDDHSRLAYSEVLADERAVTAIAFWRRARAWFDEHGVSGRAVLTDNGSCYRSNAFKRACLATGVRPLAAPGPTTPRPTARSSASTAPARGVGLRPRLPQRGGSHRRPCALAAPLQSSPRPHRPRRRASGQPCHQPPG